MTAIANLTSSPASSAKSLDEVLSTVRESDSPRVSWYQWGGLLNDRRAHRVAFPEILHVVGLNTNSDTGQFVQVSEPIVASGRDISVDGISIRHEVPLPHRYVAVSYRSPFGTETLVAKLSWCRFEREGRYVSGGRLTVEPQLESELNIDWDSLESV
jgi:hypothetical protein